MSGWCFCRSHWQDINPFRFSATSCYALLLSGTNLMLSTLMSAASSYVTAETQLSVVWILFLFLVLGPFSCSTVSLYELSFTSTCHVTWQKSKGLQVDHRFCCFSFCATCYVNPPSAAPVWHHYHYHHNHQHHTCATLKVKANSCESIVLCEMRMTHNIRAVNIGYCGEASLR